MLWAVEGAPLGGAGERGEAGSCSRGQRVGGQREGGGKSEAETSVGVSMRERVERSTYLAMRAGRPSGSRLWSRVADRAVAARTRSDRFVSWRRSTFVTSEVPFRNDLSRKFLRVRGGLFGLNQVF